MDDPVEQHSCCCQGSDGSSAPGGDNDLSPTAPPPTSDPWITGVQATPIGDIPSVRTALVGADHWGAWKVRWGVGRMRFAVEPAVYAVGEPTAESPVFVSANYKLSFDQLRSNLDGLDAWILVLDTKGVNVWCAAGKGTFGTDELVSRIESTQLAGLVTHRRVIVPQLGAPGVTAREVHKRSGFQVVFGPVRAGDLPAFMADGMSATASMRRVRFPLADRLAVAPIELIMAGKYVTVITLLLFLFGGFGPDGYGWAHVMDAGVLSAGTFATAYVMAGFLTPALLPWLPGRALSLKGIWIGGGLLMLLAGTVWRSGMFSIGWLDMVAWCFMVPATTSFIAMGFTGATTYTSLSGVRREMRFAVPLQAMAAGLGVILWCVGRFI